MAWHNRLWNVFHRDRLQRDIERELSFHSELSASVRNQRNPSLRRRDPALEQGSPGSSRASSSRAIAPARADAAVTR